jgi:hypothetical protein
LHEHILSDFSHLCRDFMGSSAATEITMSSLAEMRLAPFSNPSIMRLDSAEDQFRYQPIK